jgi:hypothetical protein
MALMAATLASGCGPGDPAAEIRERLVAAEQAAEARDGGFFRDLLAASYRDARGNDRDQMLALIRGFFLTHSQIEVVSTVDEIVLEGADAARAVLHAATIGRRAGESLIGGVEGELYRLEVELVKDGGDWRVIGASWSPALGE